MTLQSQMSAAKQAFASLPTAPQHKRKAPVLCQIRCTSFFLLLLQEPVIPVPPPHVQAALLRLHAANPMAGVAAASATPVKSEDSDDDAFSTPVERLAKLRKAAETANKLAEAAAKLAAIMEKDLFPVLDVIVPQLQNDQIPLAQLMADIRTYLVRKGFR